MTRSDQTSYDKVDRPAARPFLGQVLFYFGFSLFAGAIGAAFMFMNRGDLGGIEIGVTAALLAIGGGMTYAGIRFGDFDPPSLSSKTGRSQLLLLTYVVVGGAAGIYVNAFHTDSILDGTFQPSRTEAIVALVILAAMIPSAFYQWRQFDDFQKAAMKDATFWTFNVYFYGYIAWVIGAFGGIFPQFDHQVMFLIVTFTFLFIWAFKRSG
ncbi:hypothetical protein EH31_01610 [Erythrobacter longus]|uniref:Uncharacterized protein n=1 Tax=Erythrobacter longus TaxID=1044 RepID=A0A074M9A9_ERYLO|nr:hypothetical protein [Erythrobacter longus]KEO91386.1 hypothetical protein EH31_01610 [Erythrobacter longus]